MAPRFKRKNHSLLCYLQLIYSKPCPANGSRRTYNRFRWTSVFNSVFIHFAISRRRRAKLQVSNVQLKTKTLKPVPNARITKLYLSLVNSKLLNHSVEVFKSLGNSDAFNSVESVVIFYTVLIIMCTL